MTPAPTPQDAPDGTQGVPEERSLGPPAGLERLEAFLRSRTSDGHAYGLIADVVAWSDAAIERARQEEREKLEPIAKAAIRLCEATFKYGELADVESRLLLDGPTADFEVANLARMKADTEHREASDAYRKLRTARSASAPGSDEQKKEGK